MVELFWSAFGVFLVAFIGYALAHTWLIRPILRRIWPGFPWLDVVIPPKVEDDFWFRRDDPEKGG